MPDKTKNLGLTIWNDTDYVDFEEINDNFKKLDNASISKESGIATASYTGGLSASANWYYKKYTDGTIEMSAHLQYTNLKCNAGDSSPYYSGTSTISFPFQFSNIYDVQMHLSSNTMGWISDITGESILDCIMFRLLNTQKENENEYKQVFVSVKGVLA